MDCYAVGPTLGGGTAALMAGEPLSILTAIVRKESLINGPLRFTVSWNSNRW
ncbi:DUF4861 family protein [Bacteroides acidifaciens]|uniref:DUF4861 family protein n=1 Tax=Bacteroides acidifaciens TaxID=85831 RepID=UPI003F68F878